MEVVEDSADLDVTIGEVDALGVEKAFV